jgi:polyisoprenoid-binding protein YceI
MFSRPLLAAAALLVGATALPAQLPGAADPSRIAAGTYKADPLHTLIGWRVNHLGFNDYFGMFGTIRGTMVLDPANLAAARVAVRVPIRKVITASQGLTGHLLQGAGPSGKTDFFGRNPGDALFESTAVKPGADGKSALIEGKLTMNSVTRPVTIAATFTGAGKNPLSGKQTVGFHGMTTIKRSEWGIMGALPVVSDNVELTITAAFEKD